MEKLKRNSIGISFEFSFCFVFFLSFLQILFFGGFFEACGFCFAKLTGSQLYHYFLSQFWEAVVLCLMNLMCKKGCV